MLPSNFIWKRFFLIGNFKKFIKKLLLNLHVDNLNSSYESIKDAIEFYKVLERCLADGNIYLHKWATVCDE